MKLPTPLFLQLAAAAVLAFVAGSASAQDAAKAEKLLDFGRPSLGLQKTPDYKPAGVTDKRWKPKEWLELEFPFKIKENRKKPDQKFIDTLTFKYSVFLDPVDKKKAKVLTAEVTHVNIPVGEESASVVYISPSAIMSLTGEARPNPALVKLFQVEVMEGSTLVGFFSSDNKTPSDPQLWTKLPSLPPTEAGKLLSKNLTPFAPLWGDYHAEVQAK